MRLLYCNGGDLYCMFYLFKGINYNDFYRRRFNKLLLTYLIDFHYFNNDRVLDFVRIENDGVRVFGKKYYFKDIRVNFISEESFDYGAKILNYSIMFRMNEEVKFFDYYLKHFEGVRVPDKFSDLFKPAPLENKFKNVKYYYIKFGGYELPAVFKGVFGSKSVFFVNPILLTVAIAKELVTGDFKLLEWDEVLRSSSFNINGDSFELVFHVGSFHVANSLVVPHENLCRLLSVKGYAC